MISQEEAFVVAYYRGLACSKITTKGAMLAAGYGHDKAVETLETLGIGQSVQIACINSPQSVTFSGDEEQISVLGMYLDTTGVFNRMLRTDGKAYHSKHVTSVSDEYEVRLVAALSRLKVRETLQNETQWFSSVTGGLMGSAVNPSYWRENMESPVQFHQAIAELHKQTDATFIEIGPHPVLENPVRQSIGEFKAYEGGQLYLPSVYRDQSGVESMLKLAGNLFLNGHETSFSQVNRAGPSVSKQPKQRKSALVSRLPPYGWKHDIPLWNESNISTELRLRKYPEHEILGCRYPGTGRPAAIWRKTLKTHDVPWLKDHRIDNEVVFPAAGYIAMVIEAALQLQETDFHAGANCFLENVTIEKALVLSEDDQGDGVELQTSLHRMPTSDPEREEERWQFSIVSRVEDTTVHHASGSVRMNGAHIAAKTIAEANTVFRKSPSREQYYDRLAMAGINYNGDFKLLEDIRGNVDKSSSSIRATTIVKQGKEFRNRPLYQLHPSTVDCVMHASLMATAFGKLDSLRGMIPVSFESIRVTCRGALDPTQRYLVDSSARRGSRGTMIAESALFDAEHQLLMEARNMRLVEPFRHSQAMGPERNPILRVKWKPDITSGLDGQRKALSSYLEDFSTMSSLVASSNASNEIRAAADLIVHKNPRLRIISIEREEREDRSGLPELFQVGKAYPRCSKYARASVLADGNILIVPGSDDRAAKNIAQDPHHGLNGQWDLVIIDQVDVRML